MKNFFIFVVIILALLSIDHESIKKPRDELFAMFSDKMSESTQLQKDKLAKKVNAEIKAKLKLKEKERIHLDENTQTDEKVRAFHKRYCTDRDLNQFFYGDKLRQVCLIMTTEIAAHN
ncbi:hypothetical protein [Pseudoalteromonas tunicata]|jgi:hypothetical protein|uniref:Putative orphan protein n=1 Tax=Pseudoalteromonas tunicata D2 TaxID=87626 RepID=A4CES4_9GAMM|nr:hypothetical protein [Pseudoalteromonas tunicata]ATC96064.1 hypothetical protein PTUN_a3790 [Pseudoalteromonas tunicata]AXT31593.1 hypothetical protein D1819_12655 [Pseudoalteromonas tunicata]EAR26803.1 putative orphan protein [Pseudoalteromonas tunicata D2]MDP4982641.1 hypothetical protein [Pseudoalteromonas tunicata]MDP5213276.1 hypothetical protein [Pseudoalteromonas tunicata]